MRYKICKDLTFYREKEIESTFVEIIESKTKKKLLTAFTNIQTSQLLNLQVINPLLEKLSLEKKRDNPNLMADFNINILNCDSDKHTTDFTDTMYASS